MDMFSSFNPDNMIAGIPEVRVNGNTLNKREVALVKQTLLESEQNPNIIRAARGDGRIRIIRDIINDDRIIFGWGLKSQHAFHEHSQLRDFLEPNNVDIDKLKEVVDIFKEQLYYNYGKHFKNVRLETVNQCAESLIDKINSNRHSNENLILIKDWICATLQTSGCSDFKNITPYVSASVGEKRYKTAYLFGSGKNYNRTNKNKRFVIFDTWVNRQEEHFAYEKTQYLIECFKNLKLPWYKDIHHEIMIKYAIYPHNLIGYYYFEEDKMLYYQINPNYWEIIKQDESFQIGRDVYIEQSMVNFPANNPYRIIYSRTGNCFGVADRR